MRQTNIPACLALLAALIPFTSCSEPTQPEPQKVSAPSATTTPARAPISEPASAAVDQSISTNVGDPAKFRELMATLQQAVQKHDAPTVAALASYPIDINPHTKKTLHIRTPEAFIAQYDNIITFHIAEVIANQKYNNLFVNYQGAMFGNGELWIAGICRDKACTQTDIRIKTIQNTQGTGK